MEALVMTTGLGYQIHLDYDRIVPINRLLSEDNIFVLTDSNVARLYRDKLQIFRNPERVYVIRAGEDSKQLSVAGKVCRAMLDGGCDRRTRMVALGGGVVGDLGGFAASIYMRGIDFIQIPTTLLSMVDSSVGGKTGVDMGNYKNIIGAFRQPVRVEMSLNFLQTLDMRQIVSGLGEIVKTALLDRELFSYMENNVSKFVAAETAIVAKIVESCVKYKDKIVTSDEKENGPRKRLNLGHTIGHALETMDRHRRAHGEYVLSGLYYELKLAKSLDCIDAEYCRAALKLIYQVQDAPIAVKNAQKLVDVMKADKKNIDGKLCFILPTAPGEIKEILLEPQELLAEMKNIL